MATQVDQNQKQILGLSEAEQNDDLLTSSPKLIWQSNYATDANTVSDFKAFSKLVSSTY